MEENFDFLLNIPSEIRNYFIANLANVETKILNEVILPINDKFGKDATGKLKKSYVIESNRIGNIIILTIKNTATAEKYPGKYYWVVIRDGRKAYSGMNEHIPPWRDVEQWMQSKGIEGSPFKMAQSINEKGFEGNPQMFEEMGNETVDYLLNYIDKAIGGI